jgi:hypothetical protein
MSIGLEKAVGQEEKARRMEQTWTFGREHWATAAWRSGKKASTEERVTEAGSARKRDAEKAAWAIASSCEAEAILSSRLIWPLGATLWSWRLDEVSGVVAGVWKKLRREAIYVPVGRWFVKLARCAKMLWWWLDPWELQCSIEPPSKKQEWSQKLDVKPISGHFHREARESENADNIVSSLLRMSQYVSYIQCRRVHGIDMIK